MQSKAERPKQKPIRNIGPKVGRNDPCPCGSGKKRKKCNHEHQTVVQDAGRVG